ncbi:amidohydrolase [Psychroflexus aestuariivivens]|uniref:amidohydrolase n=1 Tax=Psychroflexus aestuariivivens TaxID=1795040 RepID=UPI000FDA5AE9|nr:amidohydrolase [Psychroflexus aestuariivivens]
MSDTLKVTYFQTELFWESPQDNRNKFEKLIEKYGKNTDLIVLPEMFTTGFSMNAEEIAESPQPTFEWMKKIAKNYQTAITGSIMAKVDQHFFNRLLFVKPDGKYDVYDKKHLFSLAKEERIYTSGKEKITINYKGWKICPMICYDLRFPAWSRNLEDYDLLIYVANWPEKRVRAWDILLKARAIENMSYTIGVNRIGKDGKDFPYVGHSAVYDFLGEKISQHPPEEEAVETLTLDYPKLQKSREKFGFLKDRDQFKIE